MRREQRMLLCFHMAAKQACPMKPKMPTEEVQKLRLALHKEEAVDELEVAFTTGDMTLVADAIGDALYVVMGTAVACGIDIEPVFHEIHRSNMTKFPCTYRDDGKAIKNPNYSPADLGPIIAAQLK